MPVRPEQLVVLVEGVTGRPSVGPVPLPTPSDVLYEPPAEPLVALRARAPHDGTKPSGRTPRATGSTGKRCDNCRLWAEREDRCCLMGRDVPVEANMVCGYHVAGDPQLYVTSLSGEGRLDPELAGLMRAPDQGTKCENCTYYEPLGSDDDGYCRAVANAETGCPANVEALGCCSRWRAKQDAEVPAAPTGA